MKRVLGLALLAVAVGAVSLQAVTYRADAQATGLQITKVVNGSNSTAPGGSVGYTITVSNPTGADILLDCVTDTFPALFTYRAGSTSGTNNPGEPSSFSYCMGWFFDGTNIVAGSSITWNFIADVSTDVSAGCYYNDATALFNNNQNSASTGPTAPVLVTGAATAVPCGQSTPTPPPVVRSATPSSTSTPLAASTSAPTKVPATATTAPPTSTPPRGGAAGTIVAPNTGTGDATQRAAAARATLALLSLLGAGGLVFAGAGMAIRRSR